MILQDGMANPGYKIYREHTTGVLCDRKATQQGVAVTAQADADGNYTVANMGTEEGWQFWEKNTRELGAWATIVPVVMTAGGLLPVASQALCSDTSYTAKTINTTGTHTVNSVVPVDGNVPAVGDYGLVVQCLEDESFELIYYPIGSSVLKVDHKTEGDLSSVVVDVKADGTLDLTNVGSYQNVFWVVGNYLCVGTDTKFYMQLGGKSGPLKFQTTAFPTLVPPEDAPYTVETKCAFDGANWRWYTRIGGGGEEAAEIFARVRWNISYNTEDYMYSQDLSEGEIVTWDDNRKQWLASGTVIWIDLFDSLPVQFETAGDNTVFSVKLSTKVQSRNMPTRSLYKIVRCYNDWGYQITHLKTIEKMVLQIPGGYRYSGLAGKLLSRQIVPQPWTDASMATIFTTIDGAQKENIMFCRVPLQWDLTGLENYAYMEASDLERGMPFYFRPIRPCCVDPDAQTYESFYKIGGEVTVASYKMYTDVELGLAI